MTANKKAREEFEQLLFDDEHFKTEWGKKDGSYKEKDFKEWLEDVFSA